MTESYQTLYGRHAVFAALKNPKRQQGVLYLSQTGSEAFRSAKITLSDKWKIQTKDKSWFEQKFGEDSVHQGIALDTPTLAPQSLKDVLEENILIMLDQVTDPHNIGAILRTAAAFGVGGVITQDRHSPKMTAVLAKTASGALEHVPLIAVTNLSQSLETLKKHGFFAYGLDERGEKTLSQLKPAKQSVIVMGAEGTGLRPLVSKNCDELIRLPTCDVMPSLNVSNACAIAVYHFSQN